MYSFYSGGDSVLHRLDPRVKLLAAGAGIAGTLLFNDPAVLLPMFAATILYGRFLGGIPVRRQMHLLKPLLPLVAITVVLWPVIYEPRLKGLVLGVSFSFRLLTIALFTFVLLMTTPQKELVLAFVKLGMPYEFGLTVSIALRYIPTLYLLASKIMDAQKSRGWEVEKGNVFVRVKRMSAVLIPLLVASLKTAHELSIALESRGFGAGRKRTALYDIRMTRRDFVAAGIVLLLFIAAVYVRYVLGFGHIDIYG
ncbi:energy-coupling factor transporter transmembrane protein EcfT [Thermococcus sp. M36]|uniref:energy-coupling factor transporter transmembrane component T family protein n=1 Tax=Thermococcus sp. M36 TaxID=1638261 RepID=UPI001981379F|nr:energy-coupling factor transporter transmembrane component T [Thermococcus sp. M36]